MFNRRRRLSASMPNQNRWLGYLLFFWAVVYWIFALALERIDLTQTYTLLAALPGIIGNIIELVHPRVLRHFIPVFVGWWFAYMAVVKTVQILYDLPDEEAARHFFKRLRLDRRLQEKPLLVPADRLTDARLQIPMLRIGGPGLVIIRPGEVAVTELQGLIFRTLPAGVHRLGRFEYIQAVLSLQEHAKNIDDVTLITRDGIKITTDFTLRYRISQGSELPTKAKPYPYDETAVKIAAYDQTVTPDRVVTWEDTPANIARGELKKIIAKYRLDEILQLENSIDEPHRIIHSELERRTRLILMDKGIDLVSLHVGRFEFPTDVTQQYIQYWKAQWEVKARLTLADGDARALQEEEVARAEAEVTMIQAIVEGVRRAQQDGHTGTVREIVAMRLIEAMEKVAKQSQNMEPLANGLLPRLTQIRHDLLPPPSISEDMQE